MNETGNTARKKAYHKKRTIFIIAVLVVLLIDFVPYPASPNFRYSGSDPNRTVMNFGFPLASFIYDSEAPPHIFIFDFFYLEILIQCAVLAFVFVLLFLIIPASSGKSNDI